MVVSVCIQDGLKIYSALDHRVVSPVWLPISIVMSLGTA